MTKYGQTDDFNRLMKVQTQHTLPASRWLRWINDLEIGIDGSQQLIWQIYGQREDVSFVKVQAYNIRYQQVVDWEEEIL